MNEEISPKDLEYFRDAFAVLDHGSDGYITIQELSSVMHALGQEPTDSELQALINEVDLDGSGAINFNEFLSMMHRKMREPFSDDELQAAFRVFDKHNTGYIDRDRLIEVFIAMGEKLTAEEVDDIIREGDHDKDGKLNFDEFVDMMTTKKPRN